MKINKSQRAAARHKKTEAVDLFLEHQKDGPVHSYSDNNKTLHRSGVVVRNDKNVGHEAMQRARDLINTIGDTIITNPRTATGTNDTWFKTHQLSVEQQIGERISVDKNPQVQREEFQPSEQNSPIQEADNFLNYRPQVDDDAEIYIPKSER